MIRNITTLSIGRSIMMNVDTIVIVLMVIMIIVVVVNGLLIRTVHKMMIKGRVVMMKIVIRITSVTRRIVVVGIVVGVK